MEYKNIFFGVEEKIKILNHGTKLFVFFDQIYIQDDIFDHDLLFIQLLLWAHNNNMLRFNLDIGTCTSRRRMKIGAVNNKEIVCLRLVVQYY